MKSIYESMDFILIFSKNTRKVAIQTLIPNNLILDEI